jgi:acetyl esterase/lipase
MRSRRVLAAGGVVVAALGVAVAISTPPGVAAGYPVAVTRDVVYRTVRGEPLTLDAYVPDTPAKRRPAMVLVHGGGWSSGDKFLLDDVAQRLAALGYVAFSVNYRLAPADPYPAAIDDVQAAVRWMRTPAQVRQYRLDPARIGALGDSAGGHLVALLATLGSGSRARGARVRAAVSWSGIMDVRGVGTPGGAATGVDDAALEFLGCAATDPTCARRERAASPIAQIDKSDAPLFLANSRNELIPLAQATTMDAALRAARVPDQLVILEGDRHTGYADDVWAATTAFLARYLGKPPTR